jgi:hypothetical protein
MNNLKSKVYVLFKENIYALSNHLENLMRGITSVFGNKLVIFIGQVEWMFSK